MKNFAQMLREGGHQVGVLQNSTGHPADGKVTSPSVTLYQSSPSMDHMSTNAGGNLHPSLPHHVGTPAASAASPSHMGTPGSTAAPTPSGTGTASNTAVGGTGRWGRTTTAAAGPASVVGGEYVGCVGVVGAFDAADAECDVEEEGGGYTFAVADGGDGAAAGAEEGAEEEEYEADE